jgi:hypothetical protein
LCFLVSLVENPFGEVWLFDDCVVGGSLSAGHVGRRGTEHLCNKGYNGPYVLTKPSKKEGTTKPILPIKQGSRTTRLDLHGTTQVRTT